MRDLSGFEFSTVVNRVATYLSPREREVDSLGNLRDDYVSELCLEALEASRKFKERYGGCHKQETRYVYKSLWNYARRKKRGRIMQKGRFFQPLNRELDPVSMEAAMEARNSLRVLRKNLEQSTWQILERMAVVGGNKTEAWMVDPTCNRLYFNSKVQKAQWQAQTILSEDEVSI